MHYRDFWLNTHQTIDFLKYVRKSFRKNLRVFNTSWRNYSSFFNWLRFLSQPLFRWTIGNFKSDCHNEMLTNINSHLLESKHIHYGTMGYTVLAYRRKFNRFNVTIHIKSRYLINTSESVHSHEQYIHSMRATERNNGTFTWEYICRITKQTPYCRINKIIT